MRPWPRRRPCPSVAAHGSGIAALQSSLTTGLSNKADQSAFDVLEGVVATKSISDGVDLKLSNYSTTAAMNGSIAFANNATLTTASRRHSLDIAARITLLGGGDQRPDCLRPALVRGHARRTQARWPPCSPRWTPLEVDTKMANVLLGLATKAFVAAQLASRDASIQGSALGH